MNELREAHASALSQVRHLKHRLTYAGPNRDTLLAALHAAEAEMERCEYAIVAAERAEDMRAVVDGLLAGEPAEHTEGVRAVAGRAAA